MVTFKTIVCVFTALLLINCSSDSKDAASSTPPDVAEALTLAATKVTKVIGDTSEIALAAVKTQTSINSEWEDSDFAIGGDFGSDPQDFILKQGDSTAQSSLMFRFNQAVENLCLFSAALPSTNNVIDLNAGSTLTLSASVKAGLTTTCGVAADQMPPDDTVVGFSVVDISSNSGSEYQRKVSFDLTGGSNYQDFFYFTISATQTRFAYHEGASTNKSAVIFDYNATTGIGRLEFSEKAPGSFELHYRVLLDENTEQGVYIAHIDGSGDGSTVAKAAVTTKEGGGDKLVVSYTFDGAGTDLIDGNACINATTFAIDADNTLTCANPAITGTAVSAFTADALAIGGTYDIDAFSESTFINFNSATNIFTAELAN